MDRIGGSSQVMGRGERRPYPGQLEYLMKNKWRKHKPKARLYRQAGSAPEKKRHRRQIQMQRQLTYLLLPKDLQLLGLDPEGMLQARKL